MSVKSIIISLLIISITVIGGTCLFGFCASADSGIPVDLEVAGLSLESEKDLPIADNIIKEDGKLDGQILTVKKANINFGEGFDLARNQQKVIQSEQSGKINTHKKLAAVKKLQSTDQVNNNDLSIEMGSVLAEIKKQEQEVRNLLSELKNIKNDQIKANDTANNVLAESVAKSNQKNDNEAKITAQIPAGNINKQTNEIVSQNTDKTNSNTQALIDSKKNIQLANMDEKFQQQKKKKKFSPMIVESGKKDNSKYDFAFKDYSKDNSGRIKNEDNQVHSGSFEKAFSALRPEKSNKPNNVLADRRKKGEVIAKASEESIKNFHNAYVNVDDVKKDFYKTYISENKYLRPFETEDDKGENTNKNDSKRAHDILQLKIEFQENSAALSAVDVNILRYFVYIAQNDPTKGVQISISQDNMKDINKKKLAARRLAIVSAIFKEEGLTDRQIIPVLTDRDTDSFIFSIISVDKMENYQKNEGTKDMFGDTVGASQTFRTMKW